MSLAQLVYLQIRVFGHRLRHLTETELSADKERTDRSSPVRCARAGSNKSSPCLPWAEKNRMHSPGSRIGQKSLRPTDPPESFPDIRERNWTSALPSGWTHSPSAGGLAGKKRRLAPSSGSRLSPRDRPADWCKSAVCVFSQLCLRAFPGKAGGVQERAGNRHMSG